MPVGKAPKLRSWIQGSVIFVVSLVSFGCSDDGNTVLVSMENSPSDQHYIEQVHTDVTAALQVSKTVVSIVKKNNRWIPDSSLVVLLDGRQSMRVEWPSDTEVIVSGVGELDVIDVGTSSWDGIRIRLRVNSGEIDQKEWKRKYGRFGRR